MKYIIFIGDGMADRPIESLGNKTPLEAAKKENIDYIAKRSVYGMTLPTPLGMVPESDTANLALLGYDPRVYSKGRSPLEALSMGIPMSDTQTAIRCNIVTLSEDSSEYEALTMIDHSSGEIDNESAAELIRYIDEHLGTEVRKFHSGVSYRHCLMWDNCQTPPEFSRPHDILGRKIKEYLPKSEEYLELMKKSYQLLKDHPINLKRKAEGKNPSYSIWLWANGMKPALPSFEERFGLKGVAISAVDLIKGIAICAGMDVINVEGATGNIKTNFSGKAKAAVDALEKYDLVYLHVEAPDECGHQGNAEEKVKSIEYLDDMLGYILENVKGMDLRILFCPDHPTPIELRTHSPESVPFIIYDTRKEENGVDTFSERSCEKGSNIPNGFKLIDTFIE
jgi:2,3-bisphosphoglycerate-independent phosphoglycerate mutase